MTYAFETEQNQQTGRLCWIAKTCVCLKLSGNSWCHAIYQYITALYFSVLWMLEICRWWMQRSQYEERVHLAGLLTSNLSASDMTTKLRRQVLNVKLMFIMKDSAIGQSWLLFLTSCSPSGHGPEWIIITILNMQTNLGILVNLCYQSFGPTISSRKTSWYQCKKTFSFQRVLIFYEQKLIWLFRENNVYYKSWHLPLSVTETDVTKRRLPVRVGLMNFELFIQNYQRRQLWIVFDRLLVIVLQCMSMP